MQQLGVDHGVNQENYEGIDLGSLGIINTETKRASIDDKEHGPGGDVIPGES
jgi:hypothetical protein